MPAGDRLAPRWNLLGECSRLQTTLPWGWEPSFLHFQEKFMS